MLLRFQISNTTQNGSNWPVVKLDRLAFEMVKKFEETKLQVILSPISLFMKDPQRNGILILTGLQVTI